ncbi:hypothetical protein OG937_25590 [Streptomyces sp. NBC_00510]
MTAWIMFACGCLSVVAGALTLKGRRAAQYRDPRKAGWGGVAMGGGFALDGGSRLAGWSSGVQWAVSIVALGLVLLGAALQVHGITDLKARPHDSEAWRQRHPR